MPKRPSPEVKRYYQAALTHHGDARCLLDARRANGCIYLAGYAIECTLKALLVSRVPVAAQKALTNSFRGREWHSFEHLKKELRKRQMTLPDAVNKQLARVNTWSVDIRYQPRRLKLSDARDILAAASEVIRWVRKEL